MRALKILFVILIFISPFILHVWKKNMVNAVNIKISNLTREVQNIERNVMLLDSKWRKKIRSDYIEEKAREKLKMRYPEKGEIIKIENFGFESKENEG
jgi:cell division protein FtsB